LAFAFVLTDSAGSVFALVSVFTLLFQANSFCGSISIALSYVFIASTVKFNLFKAFPSLFQASEFCGLISIALS